MYHVLTTLATRKPARPQRLRILGRALLPAWCLHLDADRWTGRAMCEAEEERAWSFRLFIEMVGVTARAYAALVDPDEAMFLRNQRQVRGGWIQCEQLILEGELDP